MALFGSCPLTPTFGAILGISLLFGTVLATGHIEVQLIQLEGSGYTSEGDCCDHFYYFPNTCITDCDPYLDICFDRNNGTGLNDESCAYGRITTNEFDDQNSIYFDDVTPSDLGISNPTYLQFVDFDSDGFRMDINVWDHDHNNDDLVQGISIKFTGILPDPSYEQAVVYPLVDIPSVNAAAVLKIYLRIYCDPGYYSSSCSVFCNDTFGHYECSDDGLKVCDPGWQGEDCEENIDMCLSEPCQNGGTCRDYYHYDYYCLCPPGYSGINCETLTDACVLRPCQNGGECVSGPYWAGLDYSCVCLAGYIGDDCELVDACHSEPCLNGGTCERQGAAYVCHCEMGYTGQDCDTVAESHALLNFQLVSYENADGRGANGNCCDGYGNFCPSACDTYFHVCLDTLDGGDSLESCAIGRHYSKTYQNQNSLDLTSSPVVAVFSLTQWLPDGLRIKVDVYDKDPGADDFIDYFSQEVQLPASLNFFAGNMTSRTTLTYELSVDCEPGWQGVVCSEN